MNPAVFLDRDGVLNKAVIKDGKPYPPASVDELILAEDAYHSLWDLKADGYLLIVVTNQPDVSRGKTSLESVEAINNHLRRRLPLDDVLSCYHDDQDQCHCRKPKPGLLLEAAKRYSIDLSLSIMVGDRWRDIEAGQKAGCQTVWLDFNYLEKKPVSPDFTTQSLTQATSWILTRRNHD